VVIKTESVDVTLVQKFANRVYKSVTHIVGSPKEVIRRCCYRHFFVV
jgi:hypothetical protein